MLNTKCSMILIVIMLIVIPVLQSRAAEVRGIRSDSKSDGTRIVLDVDGTVLYRTQYTMEPSVSISLFETELGSTRRTTSIDDDLVTTVTARETPVDNTVETVVDVSLKRSATVAVFPLSGRIVIDITPDTATVVAQPLDAPAEVLKEDIEASGPLSDDRVDGSSNLGVMIPSPITYHKLAQFGVDLLPMIALIIMGIVLWRVARISKRNSNILKRGQNFADMISRLQQDTEGRDDSTGAQHSAPEKARASGKIRKKSRRKEGAAQPVALQKQYEKVYKLAQLGMDRLAISQQSNVPIGEVNLILDLSKARSQSKAC